MQSALLGIVARLDEEGVFFFKPVRLFCVLGGHLGS